MLCATHTLLTVHINDKFHSFEGIGVHLHIFNRKWLCISLPFFLFSRIFRTGVGSGELVAADILQVGHNVIIDTSRIDRPIMTDYLYSARSES